MGDVAVRQSFRLKKARWIAGAVIAGGLAFSPVLAQQLASRLLPEPVAGQGNDAALASDKDVMLAPDGSFRVAVLTPDGRFVPEARVVMTRQQEPPAQPGTFTTGSDGQAIVAGVRPGIYEVSVHAGEKGTHEWRLWVWQANVTATSAARPIVVFTVMKCEQPAAAAAAVRGQSGAGLFGAAPTARQAAMLGLIALPIAAAAMIPLLDEAHDDKNSKSDATSDPEKTLKPVVSP